MLKKLLDKHPIIRQMLLYGIIGGLSAGLDSLAYYLLTRLGSVPELYANFISVNIGIVVSFTLNTFINFKTKDKILIRAVCFYIVGYLGLGLSMVLLHVGVKYMGINDMVVKLSSVFIVAAVQFMLNKLIAFRK